MQNIMLDLETLGISAGCKILSIGAVAFDPATGKLDAEWELDDVSGVMRLSGGFYIAVSREDQEQYGLREDDDTVKWWNRQDATAKAVLSDPAAVPLYDALEEFGTYVRGFGSQVRVWGNGADFDNAILSDCYRRTPSRQPWGAYSGRCYRTLKNMTQAVKLERKGTHHNALADAMCQAEHALAICKLRGILELG